MIRITLLLATIFIGLNSFAQFRTEVDDDGERITERIDENGMKQGPFVYYSHLGEVIRSETYLNDVVSKRKCLKKDTWIDATTFDFKSIARDSKKPNGEVIFYSDGTYNIFFYTTNPGINNDKIKAICRSDYNSKKNLVLQF